MPLVMLVVGEVVVRDVDEDRPVENFCNSAERRGVEGDFLKFIKFATVTSFCAVVSTILDIEFESSSLKVVSVPSVLA